MRFRGAILTQEYTTDMYMKFASGHAGPSLGPLLPVMKNETI